MQDSQQNLVGGRSCALRFWKIVGQLELSGWPGGIRVRPLHGAVSCRSPACAQWY